MNQNEQDIVSHISVDEVEITEIPIHLSLFLKVKAKIFDWYHLEKEDLSMQFLQD